MRWHLRVPASIANLGPGFDILALAIDLENEVVVTSRDDGLILVDTDEGPEAPAGDDNLMVRAYRFASGRLGDGAHLPGAHFNCRNRIAMGSGLGSSAAAIIAGIIAAHLVNQPPLGGDQATSAADPAGIGLDKGAILDCATEMEGHPDNVAAALLGGLVICSSGAAVQRVDLPDNLCCVIYVPTEQSATPESRAAVPATFSREDAVFNAGRTALLVRALVMNDPVSLAEAMQDRWHQPYRSRFFPAWNPVIGAAEGAGAYGASLAGAGPSIVALCAPERGERIGRAMTTAAEACGVAGGILMTGVRNRGAIARRLD